MSRPGVTGVAWRGTWSLIAGLMAGLGIGGAIGFQFGKQAAADRPTPFEITRRPAPQPEVAGADLREPVVTAVEAPPIAAAAPEPVVSPAVPAPLRTGDVLLLRFFDRDGDECARTGTVAVTQSSCPALDGLDEQAFVVAPAAVLEHAMEAVVERDGKMIGGVNIVAARDGPSGVALLGIDVAAAPVDISTRDTRTAARWTARESGRADRFVTVRARRFDADRRCETLVVDEAAGASIILDDIGRIAGFGVVPSGPDDGSPWVFALEVHDVERCSRLAMSLRDYHENHAAGTAAAWVRLARKRLRSGAFAEATSAFRAALVAGAGRTPELEFEFLNALRGMDRTLDGASSGARLEFLRAALADFPREAAWWTDLARLARAAESFEEALTAIARAAALDPARADEARRGRAEVWAAWSERLASSGRLGDALSIDATAVAEAPEIADGWLRLAEHSMQGRDFASAARAYREAIARDGALATTYTQAAIHAEKLSDGPGKVVIDYAPGSRTIMARVAINGKFGDFIVDTGAQATMVPESVAKSAGLDTSTNVPRITVRTAGGDRVLPLSPVREISMGPLTLSGASVIVGDLPGQAGRGLLGMDFLGAFAFENDARHGRFVIYRP